MTLDYRSIIKVGSLGVLAVYLISQAQELIQAIKDHRQVKKSKVKSINDYTKKLQDNQKSRLNVVKMKPYYFQQKERQISIEIHSAERYKFEPSDSKIIRQQRKTLSSKIDEKRNNYQIPITWYALVDPCKYTNGKHFCQIQGLGKIQGDFFDLKRQYIPKKHLNYWHKFRNWIYERIYKSSSLIQQARPFEFFIGPVIGTLHYDISLMKEINIVAVCNFENGKIIPTVTATSKSEILNYYRNFIREKYVKVGILLVGAIIIGRWLWSDIKKQINAAKVRKNKASIQYFNAEDVSQDKMCIICYNHVRNMIFFDCRHMIMCQECSETYDSDVCPYCKMEIDDIKPVIGIV